MKVRPHHVFGLAFLFGALIGQIEGIGVQTVLELGFNSPGPEMFRVSWMYGLIGMALVAVAWPLAMLLRLPRASSTAVALWAGLGFAWIVGNWWLQGEYLRNIPITSKASLTWLAGTSLALFVLHFVLNAAARAAGRPMLKALIATLVILPIGSHFILKSGTVAKPLDEIEADLPDVTVVVIDTLRADHLGTYGYERPDGEETSPHLDQLALQGVVFENAWAQAPWTRPSMASLHSGLFCSGHTVNQVYNRLPEDVISLAEMAHDKGYRTGGFSANANVSVTYGFGQGFERLWTVGKPRTLLSFTRFGELQHFLTNKVFHGFLFDGADHAALVNENVTDWLDEIEGDPRPKFTYVHYIDPHTPYEPPADSFPFEGGLSDLSGMDEFLKGRASGKVGEYPFGAYPNPGPDLIAAVVRNYDAEIRYVDNEFAKLTAELRERGLLDPEDWLIITADHGEEFYERGRWGHGQSLFEEQLHIPMIVLGPGIEQGVEGGVRQEQEVNLLDIHATLADIVGYEAAPVPHPESGELIPRESPSLSLVPLLDGQAHPDLARTLYAERLQDQVEMRAVRRDFRKLIEVPDDEFSSETELAMMRFWVDLRTNPNEDLGYSAEDILSGGFIPRDQPGFDPPADLNALFDYMRNEAVRGQVGTVIANMSAEERQRLIDLGYLDDEGNETHGVGHTSSGDSEKDGE